jgi:hypothetical protein
MTKLRQLRLGLALCLCLALPALARAQAHTKWYLAEGNAGFFDEEILAVNPTASAAIGVVHVLRNGAAPIDIPFTVLPLRRLTVNVKQLAVLNGLPADIGDVSAAIEVTNGVPIFVERTMYWNNRNAGSNAAALEAPSTTWYLAEGAANSFFDSFILLANPSGSDAHANLSLQKDDGSIYPLAVTVPANQRVTVYVNTLPNFGNASFSTVITSDIAIFAERSMYWNHFTGGHDATAVAAPSNVWRFAEGFTGSGFETFFLLNNPSGTDTSTNLRFLLDSGTVIDKQVTVAAHSRLTVRVNDYQDLTNQAFGTLITSTQGIVAERAMYWGGYKEGHDTAGLTAEANSFAFAEGAAGTVGNIPYETFFLFANSSDAPIDVQGTFYREDGTGNQQTYTIPAHSRFTLFGASVPDMANQRFAAMFKSVNPSQTFIVERAIYWSNRAAGTVSTGTPWNDQIVAPPPVVVAPPPPPPPPPPPSCDAVICDSLQGSTVGQFLGGAFDGFGFVATGENAGIRYVVDPTITSGYFEAEVTGIRQEGDNGNEKPKIMAMFDTTWDSGNLYRATAEKRDSNKDNSVRFKFLTGSGDAGRYIEVDTPGGWNPNEVYKFRMEWTPGSARLIIFRGDGSVFANVGGGAGTYNPRRHVLQIGNPNAGDHATYVGMRVRNVKIGRN